MYLHLVCEIAPSLYFQDKYEIPMMNVATDLFHTNSKASPEDEVGNDTLLINVGVLMTFLMCRNE